MKQIIVIYIVLGLLGCNQNTSDLNGHWYLTSLISGQSLYLEFKIDVASDSIQINRDGYYWYKQPFKYNADGRMQIGKLKHSATLINKDSLIMEGGDTKAIFKKLSSQHFLTKKEERMIRRFYYYTRTIPKENIDEIENLKYDMWVFFGGGYDTIRLEEDIEVKLDTTRQQ